MQPEAILAHPAVRLTEDERRHCFEQGYVGLEGAISPSWTERLRAAMAELVEASRGGAPNPTTSTCSRRAFARTFAAASHLQPPGPAPGVLGVHPERRDDRPCELSPDWAREGYGGPWKRQRAAERAVPGR